MLNEWQRRAARADELAQAHGYAAEVLRFYAGLARFQGELSREFAGLLDGTRQNANRKAGDPDRKLRAHSLTPKIAEPFEQFLRFVEKNAPDALRVTAIEIRGLNPDGVLGLLRSFWNENPTPSTPDARDFFARAFLQPYAVALRLKDRKNVARGGSTPFVCPFCERKPGLGVLRPLGEGSQRSLICSFCLEEWQFRRILCPGCGEEDYAKLPVYTASEVENVRVEACESCRTYTKTVDMTKSGHPEPIVDEIAAIPLDLWAREQGYAKLQPNLLQL